MLTGILLGPIALKIFMIFLILALVATNGYWILKTVDQAVTLHYAASSSNTSERQLKQAMHIANLRVIGMSADEVLKLSNLSLDGIPPFEKEGCVNVGLICLELNDARYVISARSGLNM